MLFDVPLVVVQYVSGYYLVGWNIYLTNRLQMTS